MRWKEVSLKKYSLKVKLHSSLFPELPNPNKLLGKLLCGCSQARGSKFTIKAKFYFSPMSKGFSIPPKNITSRKKLLFGNVLDRLKGERSCITKSFVWHKLSEVLLNLWFNQWWQWSLTCLSEFFSSQHIWSYSQMCPATMELNWSFQEKLEFLSWDKILPALDLHMQIDVNGTNIWFSTQTCLC